MAARNGFLQGDIDFEADTILLALVGPGFTFDDSNVHLADVTGLLAAAPRTLSVTTVNGGRVLVSDVTFPGVDGTDAVRGLLAYKDTGDPATSPLIALIDGRADTVPLDITPNGGDITFSFNYLVKI